MLSIRHLIIRNFSSKFKPNNKVKIKAEALTSLLEKNHVDIEWESVRNELIASEKFINKSNLDGVVIEKCFNASRLDVAKSYVEFINSKSLQLNDSTVGKYVRLFHCQHKLISENVDNASRLPAQDEDEIIRLSDYLIKKHEILEATLAENVIFGLSLTRNWMKCIDLLKHIEFTSIPSSRTYSCVISKALDEDKLDIVWNLLHTVLANQRAPSTFLIKKFFSKYQNDDAKMEKMMNLIGDYCLMLPEDEINEFKEILKGRNCESVSITRKGFCRSCSDQLKKVELNEDEFKKLSKTFLEDVMVTKDVYLKTNPAELRKFMKFVELTIPFDCVIDGLNVAYSHGPQPSVLMAKNVESVLKYFLDRGKTCLVIGRRHMNKWPHAQMDFIRKNSSLFLAEDLSHDDPFLLYAALKSGPDTNIFSRDLMRSHSTLLDFESRLLFRRWQLRNQYSLVTTLEDKRIIVKEPVAFEVKAQKIDSRWHIPFTSENLNFSHETFEIPSSWLCVEIGQDS